MPRRATDTLRQDEAEAMTLMNQEMVYSSVGTKIKDDLYDGNAVVLFAYGLSGSGKTFTVFGPDAIDIPEVRLVPPFRGRWFDDCVNE